MTTDTEPEHAGDGKSELKGIIPAVVTECALGADGPVCVKAQTVTSIATAIGASNETDPVAVMEKAKAATHCGTIQCTLNKLENAIGKDVVAQELATNFKKPGPINSNLLNNAHIDNTLKQWESKFAHFHAFPFAMRDYTKRSFVGTRVIDRPCEMYLKAASDLYAEGKRTVGCVINTDWFSGRGKHWMALFIDMRGTEWSVEFFNSSGNGALPEYAAWLTRTKADLQNFASQLKPPPTIKITTVCRKHQSSRSECGPYSLFYIWSRLNGVNSKVFQNTSVPDSIMFEFRQHLFEDESHKDVAAKQFNWSAVENKLRVAWEKSRPNDLPENFTSWVNNTT